MTPSSRVLNLISQGMGPELHWFPEDVSISRLAATLVGMANSSGGTVLIGISPRSGQVQGVRDPGEVVDRAFQAALLADPPLVLPLPAVVPVGPTQIVQVTVPRGLPNVYNLGGSYLGREGRQTNPLPARQLRQLLIERGTVQFDASVPRGATLDDLDPEQVAIYTQKVWQQSPHPPGQAQPDPKEVLLRRGCLQWTGEAAGIRELRPTYAALLMFGRRPQQWVPSATILAARFSGPTFTDQFTRHDIRGTLPEQLHQAEAFLGDYVRSTVRLVGLAHQEAYPFEAVRELLINAVAHRDYNIQGDTIHVNIFSDRLEVQSPGGLPGPVTLENLLKARFSRNAIIVQALSDLGYVERLGYGLDRVVAVTRQAGLRPPRFEECGGCFKVTLFAAAGSQPPSWAGQEGDSSLPLSPALDRAALRELNLNPRQEAALAHLAAHRRITSSVFQELCPEVHPETLRRDLVDLVARGILIKVGDKKATYYILK